MYFQDNLIQLLQPIVRRHLSTTEPAVLHPFRRLQTWFSRRSKLLIGLVLLEDIDIGDRAKLTMSPTVRGLYARNVNMGKESRLRFTSGNVHVRCQTLNGPSRFGTSVKEALHALEKHVQGLRREVLP